MSQAFLIAIAGGSGAGKSTLARQIQQRFGKEHVAVVEQDWYYRDLSHLPAEVAAETNFDHPDALELGLLATQLESLKLGETIQSPRYHFSSFSRKPALIPLESRPIIVVDGLFLLHEASLRGLFDLSVFIDAPSEIRLKRRIQRDQAEREYSLERILHFWETDAIPMYEQFVEPQKRHAEIIWKSLEDKAFVPQFLADLDKRLARNADKPTPG